MTKKLPGYLEGGSGPVVALLYAFLRGAGYGDGLTAGTDSYDAMGRNAMERWQSENSLDADGGCGPDTRAYMLSAYNFDLEAETRAAASDESHDARTGRLLSAFLKGAGRGKKIVPNAAFCEPSLMRALKSWQIANAGRDEGAIGDETAECMKNAWNFDLEVELAAFDGKAHSVFVQLDETIQTFDPVNDTVVEAAAKEVVHEPARYDVARQ